MTGVPNAAVGTVYLADGVTAVTNGMTLTSAELTGLVFRPMADANGNAGSFSYTVTDGNGGSDSQTVALDVTPVNDAPVADADKTVSVAEELGQHRPWHIWPHGCRRRSPHHHRDGHPQRGCRYGLSIRWHDAGCQRHDPDRRAADGPAVPPHGRCQRRRRQLQLHGHRRQRRLRQPDRQPRRHPGQRRSNRRCRQDRDGRRRLGNSALGIAARHGRRRRSPYHHRDGRSERCRRYGLPRRRHHGRGQRHDAELGRAHGPAVPPRGRRQRRRRQLQLHGQRRQRRLRQPDRQPRRHPGERRPGGRCRQDGQRHRGLRQQRPRHRGTHGCRRRPPHHHR